MNILALQCGGPTAVFNATLAAMLATSQAYIGVRHFWGSRLGWQGLATGDWVALGDLSFDDLAQLSQQPGAALGSGRYPLRDDLLPQVMAQLHKQQISAVLPIGGNGTMAAIAVDSRAKVDAMHKKALELGGTDEGAVGERGTSGFYAGYFRDLDGNKLNIFTMPQPA